MVAAHRSRRRRDPLLVPTPLAPVGVGIVVPRQGLGGGGPTGIQWMPAIGPNHAEYEYGYHYWNLGNDYINFTIFDDIALWLRQSGKMHDFSKVEALLRPVELLCLTEMVRSAPRFILTAAGAPYNFAQTVTGHFTQFGNIKFQSSRLLPPHTAVVHCTDIHDRRIAFTPRLTILPLRKRPGFAYLSQMQREYGSCLGRTLVLTNIRSLTD